MSASPEIKFVFFGTPHRAVLTLDILKEHSLLPSLIITQPDAAKGRGHRMEESEVKKWSKENSIPVLTPDKLDENLKKELAKENWDMFVVVAYGKILPAWLLEIPKHGTLNIHFSLLPLYRGATPVETQILEGAEETGVTIMLMDEKMDHGDIVSQEVIPMPDPLPSNEELVEILSQIGGRLLAETMPQWIEGGIEAQSQEHRYATFTRKFEKQEAEIDLNKDAVENFRKIQAFSTWPRAYFFADPPEGKGKKIRIVVTEAHIEDDKLVLDKVIPAGKKEMWWKDFNRNL